MTFLQSVPGFFGGPVIQLAIALFTIVAGGSFIVLRLQPPKPKKPRGRRRKRIRRNEYVPRAGGMDMTGHGWSYHSAHNKARKMSGDLTEIEASSLKGWFNFILLQGIFFILAMFWHQYKENGHILYGWAYIKKYIIGSIPETAFWGIGLWLYTFSAYFVQYFTAKAPLLAYPIGMAQHGLQTVMLFTVWRQCYTSTHWPWTQKMALQLHTAVMYMKMHSYMLTNDELRANASHAKSQKTKPAGGAPRQQLYSSASEDETIDAEKASREDMEQWLRGFGVKMSKWVSDDGVRRAVRHVLAVQEHRKTCWPHNISLFDWARFTFFPVVCYEPLYPRTEKIRWWYVTEKFFMGLAVLCIMWTLLYFIQPTLSDPDVFELDAMIRLNVPMSFFFIAGFMLVFDCLLTFVSELTYFGDRFFYEDWWNSTSFKEFSRKWNRPIHEFLHRHIYTHAMEKIGMKQNSALVGTFVFSIALHEIILTGCFHQFFPVLAFFSLMQLPLYHIMDIKLFKGNRFGNFLVLASLIISFPMLSILYAKGYCRVVDCRIGRYR